MKPLAIFILILAGACRLSGADFIDWFESSHPSYSVLKKAADEAGAQGWEAERLRQGRPLPQASARILAEALRRDPKVSEESKLNLATAFPSEVSEALNNNLGGLEESKRHLEENEAKLKEIEDIIARNNYSPTSTLGTRLSFDASSQMLSFEGVARRHFSQNPIVLSSEFGGQAGPASYKFRLSYQSDTEDRGPFLVTHGFGFVDAGLTLMASPFGFQNVECTLGFNSLILSKLVYAAPTYPYQSPFYQAGAVISAVRADSPNGERNSQGVYFRKQGSQGWWILNDFQLMAAPESEAYQSFNHTHAWELASRADLPSFGWIPFTESTLLYGSYYFYGNESAELTAFQDNSSFYQTPLAVPEKSHNLAVGFESQLNGGGTLIFEGASSSWTKETTALYPAVKDSNLADSAWYAALSKSMGRMIVALQGSQAGPRFVPGGHHANQTFRSSGMVLDSLQFNDKSWYTLSEDPAWMVNNSQRASLQASWLDSWGSLSFALASARQIEPSGYWVIGSNFFNNSPYNGYSYFQLFFNNYTPSSQAVSNPALGNYNAASTKGGVMWNDLEQLNWRNTVQGIALSQKGVGDLALRKDSVKCTNSFRADLSLELGSIFGSPRKSHLQLFEELRDTAEQLRLALGASDGLLLQSITGMDLAWQFAAEWELVATAGHESWLSSMSYFPVNMADDTAGLGVNALLTRLVDGLQLNARMLTMRHMDAQFPVRDFSGWRSYLGLSYVFAN